MKNFFKNENGFSLAEMLVASGIVAIGGVVLFKTGAITHLNSKKVERSSNVSLLIDDLVKGTSSLLAKSENTQGKKVMGICPLVSTSANSPGVGSINISLNNASKVFADAKWDRYLTSWTETSSDECDLSGGWGKCYKVNYDKTASSFSEKEIENQNIIASVVVSPVNMNPHTNGGDVLFKKISKSDTTLFDAKDLGFEINATLYFSDATGKRQQKVLKDFFWSPNVGLCDYELSNGTEVKLSLNGAGATDPDGNTIYNRSGFSGNLKEPIDINWKKTQAQAGVVTNNGNFISTDTSQNIFGSCNEVKYRCPQINSRSREYSEIKLYTNVRYNKFNKINEGKGSQSSYFAPRIELRKGESGNLLGSSSQTYTFDGDEQNVGAGSRVSKAHTVSFTIKDRNSQNATNICRSICTEKNNYNTNDLSWEDRFTPYLKAVFSNNKNAESYAYSAGQELGCTACYMKNCSQYGIGTFGAMSKMPTHPLDSSLPECSLKEDATLVNTPAALLSKKTINTPWSNSTPTCMSATLNQSTNELEYKPEDCTKQLPVLCYNFGGYVLAKDIEGTNEALSSVSYHQAPRRCFEMGREVARVSELDQFLGKAFKAPQNSDGNYEFINVANQGIFLAPQFKQDVVDLSSWFMRNSHNTSLRFWVAAVRDGKGNIIARPPFAPAYKGSDKYALNYNYSGSLNSEVYPNSLGLDQDSGPKAFMLSHHVKFKGLFPAASEKPRGNTRFAFLCRKKGVNGAFFVSKKKSARVSDGDSSCSSEAGLFIPPITPVGWVAAMAAVNPLSTNYGYPNPKQLSVDSIPLVWVGMKSGGVAANYFKNWYFSSSNLLSVGNTSQYTPSSADNNFTIVDNKGDYINPRAQLIGNSVPGNIKILPNRRFEVVSSTHSNESPNLNDSALLKDESMDHWIGFLNAKVSGAKFTKDSGAGSGSKMVVTGIKPGPGNYLKLTNSTVSKFGFGYSNRSAKSPEGYHLCYSPGDGRVSLKSYYDNCNGLIIKKDQLIGTKSGRAIFNMLNLGSSIKIDLPL